MGYQAGYLANTVTIPYLRTFVASSSGHHGELLVLLVELGYGRFLGVAA